jgi:hypothetical protein
MKKWVLFLLIAGFVTSNIDYAKVAENTSPEKNSNMHEEEYTFSENSHQSIKEDQQFFLFLSLDNDKVRKAVLTKMSNDSQTIGVATFSEEEIKQMMIPNQSVNIQLISKDNQLKEKIETNLGVPIKNIVALEKQGYKALFSRIFPEGLPLRLTDDMKKDLQISVESEQSNVDINEFIKTITMLKETRKYQHELNQVIFNTVSSQLSKPEVLISLFSLLSEVDEYLFTDLTLEELLAIGIDVMKNPVQEVQKMELPIPQDQEVLDTKQNIINQL